MASIQGKVAIVTGSARGIGAGIAARFGKEGVKVICLDRNPAAETVNHIKSNGGDAMAIQCDISKQASIEAAVRQALDTYGTIDILVNSAGLSKMASITDATEADWDYVNNVTLKGTWLMIKGVAPTMKANKSGKIINIASISGCVAFVDQSIYTPLFIDINSPLEGKFLQDCIDGHPIGRISTPDDIAGPAVFLASDDASFICGHILMVDGGWTAK